MEHLELVTESSLIGLGLNLTYDPLIKRAREIKASRILFNISDYPQLKSLVLQNLQFPIELSTNVNLKLQKLAIHKDGSFFSEACGYDDKGKNVFKTTFYNLNQKILYIPVFHTSRLDCQGNT